MISTLRRLFLALFVILVPWCLVSSAQGQGLTNLLSKGGASSTAQTTTAPSDPFGRETPRDSMRSFLESCHGNKFERATQYLDLRKLSRAQRLAEGPRIAEQLCALLDHDSRFELEKLDNAPEGRRDDGLPIDIDLLQTFDLNDESIPLYLQREKDQGVDVWVASADSVLRIPQLSELAAGPAIEKKLPQPLVKIRFVGTPLWIWLALVLLALLLSFFSKLLSRFVLWCINSLARRLFKTTALTRLETFSDPVRLLISIAVFRFCMSIVAPSALLRDYLLKMLALLAVLGIASLAMRIVDVISDHLTSRLATRNSTLSYSVLPLGVRFVKISIFSIGVLAVLANWGYNTSTILAGLGVGGLAVALAAQKTIENLFGSIAVISDRPVLVGDFCQFGGQVGTVEDIGLRSTRIRTLDRTVVTIPNAQFSTMTLENYSRRDRMWFHPTLSVRRGTSSEELKAFMEAVEKILREHPMVDPTTVPVRFSKIAKESFDFEIFAYVKTPSSDEFLKVQSQLLLQFIEAASALNVVFAVPVLENIVTSDDDDSNKNFRVLFPSNGSSDKAVESDTPVRKQSEP